MAAALRGSANCVNGPVTVTMSPPPVGGTYQCGQTVTFCLTIPGYTLTNANWLHGITATFGPGWDMSTLTPGPPPATVGGSGGTWGWYNSVTGTSTAGANAGTVGPGFFFDLDNDGNPGDNFGDNATVGPWTVCWTISVLNTPFCVGGADLTVQFRAYADSQTGSWGTGGCGNALVNTTPLTVATCNLNPGTNGTLVTCSSAASSSLFAQLGGGPQGGGTWTGPGGGAHGPNYNPAVDGPGVYTYTVTGVAPCTNASATVTVTEHPAPNAGADGTLTTCGNSGTTALFSLLTGAQAGGAWTAPGGAPFGGTYDPSSDAPGVYTYTVAGTPPCPNDQATVTVTENPPPNAGADGALNTCNSTPPTNMFPLLAGAQPGGTWTGPGGGAHGATYDPGIDGPGIYTYTVVGTPPCANDQATVTVTLTPAPNAGGDGALTICGNSAAASLFAQLTGAQAGGSWTDPGGAVHGPNYDPAADGPGVYTYTVGGTPPCTSDQSTVTVTETAPPNAGADGVLSTCGSSAATNLFGLLAGAQPGGAWTGPGGAAHGPNYDPASDGPGVYTYTITGTAPCLNAQATVTVTETAPPNAGGDGTLTVCSTSAPAGLFAQLTGAQPGGSWTDPGGAAHGGTYDPDVNGPGTYTYTVAGTAPCPNDHATVVVTENVPPNAGNDGTLTLCSNSGSTGLFTALTGAQAGGTWTDPNGVAHGPNYVPSVDITGVYTYTVNGTAPCANDQATVTVTEETLPNAGGDGTLTTCGNSATTDLFTLLTGAQLGGTWTAPGGAAHGGIYDPVANGPGVYTYTITGLAPCPNDQATVTVTENTPPNAGTDGVLTVCSSGGSSALFSALTGAQGGGSWTDPGGAAHGPNYDPATDGPGVYTYTVAGIAPCVNDQATVTVTENPAPNAGTDGTLTVCANSPAAGLFAQLGGGAQAGGTWTEPGGAAHSGTYDPAANGPGVYTYTVAGAALCPNDQAIVTVTENAPPNAGVDATLTVCSTSGASDMFSLLTGAEPGGNWTAPGGGAHGANYDPAVDAAGVFTYTVAGIAPCANDQATVTVTENIAPNAGTDGTLTVCGDGAPAGLFAQLGGADAGGSWTAPGGAPHGGTYDPAANGPGVYTYTVAGAAPCPNDQATVNVTENAPPNAGADATLTVCSTSAASDMFSLLTGAEPGGTWTAPGGGAHGTNYDPATDAAGVFTYTVVGIAPCANDQATVIVTENIAPDAGSDGTLTVCGDGAPAGLFAQLGGADAGGSWTAPGGAPHSGNYDPAANGPGVYTYTVVGAAPCPNDQAIVTVTENAPPNAGTDATLTVCSTSGASDMFALLTGAEPGGTWTAPGGAAHSANYDPAADAAGVFTYTVVGIAPCANDQATVIVTENIAPNAGSDGTLTVCGDGAPAGLFAQLGGADPGGAWGDPGGAAHSGTYDPVANGPGVYTYTVAGAAPCPNDQAIVTVTENAPPNAGVDATLTVCSTSGASDMFSLLTGAEPGGNWTAPGGGAHGANYDPAVDAAGVFTYTVAGIAPCANDQATVTVTENIAPNAGTDGTLTVCGDGAPAGLFAQLGGADPGGTWSDPGGAAHSGTYDPATNGPGVYTYTVPGAAPCPNDQATINVTENAPPNAGADATLTVCSTSGASDMFSLLIGAEPGGTWTAPGGSAHGANYDPAVDAAGVFTYTVAGIAPCANDQATVTVTENIAPNAGSDGTLTVCGDGAPAGLFAQLGGADPGGAWSDPSGAAHSGTYDPVANGPGVYTYTVAGAAPCPNDQAIVTVTENAPPNAGADATLTVCSTSGASDMFSLLIGAEPGGTWTAPGGGAHGANYDPAVDAAGIFTYTVAGIAPCANDQATVTVTENIAPNAGSDGTLTVCGDGAPAGLFAQLGGADPGGTWSEPGGAAHNGTYDPAANGPGVYTYTVAGAAPCPNDQAIVTVTENAPPNAGTDATLTACSTSGASDMFSLLIGAEPGGTWTAPGGGAHGANYDPATDAAGVFTYTVAGIAPCANDQAIVTVTENIAPNAGTDGTLTVCGDGAPAGLFAQLGGAGPGGTWSDPGGAAHSGTYDPAANGPGVYTYTMAGAAPCPNDQAIVTVTENALPNAGADATLTVCSTSAASDMFSLLTGAQPGGTWTAPGGGAHGANYDPATDDAGVFTYTVAGIAPCANDQATVTVTENVAPNAGTDGTLSVCDQGAATSLFAQLTGADPGGTWTAPGGSAHGASYDPATDAPGVYTYTVSGTAPCSADQASITVSETTAPDAGTDGAITLCASDASVDLFSLLTGADGGGTWTAPGGAAHSSTLDPAVDAAGVYTYTIAAVAPCTGDQAQVTVAINTPPNAGTDGVLTVCDQGGATTMFPQLVGADLGGSWTAPGGAAHSGSYDPAADAPGIYTYTVNGTAPCSADQATVTVSETSSPNAGLDGTITLCASDASVDLFSLLTGADGGGTWTAPGGAAHSSTLDPAVDAAGVYTYTIAAIAPCTGDQAQVSVSISTPPNAGADGVLTVCDQGGPAAMFPQLVGADLGGSWTAPGGAAHNGSYDPATDAPGIYTYTVNGAAPCTADQATVTVSETSSPNAGLDGTITLCASDASVDLFSLLTGADGGGTWTAPAGAAHSSTLDPAVDAAGVYTYTIAAIAPCTGDQAQVTVAISTPPNAGTDGVLTVCDQGGPAAMFPQLVGADLGGSWTAPGGAAHSGSYDPATDAPGVYTYTVNGTAPCSADQATVTVSETSSPNAGLDGTVTLCASDASVDLFSLLTGADGGGTWTAPGGAAHSSTLDPAVDAPGVYTYTIAAVAPCTGDQAQVTVAISTPPNAGTDGVLTVCDQGGATTMFPQLVGADLGGSWTAPGGAAHNGSYDPATDAPGVYTYTVNGTAPCTADQATVTVSETSSPNAGTDGNITLCASDASVDLFSLLTGADGGGTWTAPGGAAHSNTLDAAVDAAGVYTYTIAAVAPCTGDQAQVTVAINTPPNAGTDGVLTVCDQGGATTMFPQLVGADLGGSWTAPGGAAHSGSYDPAADALGVYTYTVNGTAPCLADQATVTVSETSSPNAGVDGTITLCASDASVDLFSLLTGADGGGTWTAPGGAAHSSTLDPASDASGIYTYTIAAIAPCAGDQAQVTVLINTPPNAGTDGVLTVCDQGGPAAMFPQLVGADLGGSWTAPGGAAHSGSYDPATDAPGVYTYTVNGTAPCTADQATVTVSETSSPNAGLDGTITLCASDASVDLFSLLTGADGGGTWSAPGGAAHSSTLDPAVDAPGVYTYTIAAVAPCTGDQAQVTVAISTPPNAGTDGVLTVCDQGGATAMFPQLVGADLSGSWTAPGGAAHSGSYDPAADAPGIYTYTVNGTAPCSADQATVTVSETSSPNAGLDGTITLCASDASVVLFALLTGADGGGTWTAPGGAAHSSTLDPASDASGIYTYTIAAVAPVGSSRVDLQACKLEYSIVSPK